MTISRKIMLGLTAVVIFSLGIFAVRENFMVMESHRSLERDEARRALHRIEAIIQVEVGHLDTTCRDWATWDSLYAYVEDHSPEFRRENLHDGALQSSGVDLILLFDAAGALEEKLISPVFMKGPLPPEFLEGLYEALAPPCQGILKTPQGLIMVASRPIIRSDGHGVPRGTCVMGRVVDAEAVENLRRQSSSQVYIDPGEGKIFEELLRAEDGMALDQSRDDLLLGYALIKDISGVPVGVLRGEFSRPFHQAGKGMVRSSLVAILATGIVSLGAMMILLRHVVVRPLGELAAQLRAPRREGEGVAKLISDDRDDEIGVVARAFNALIADLEESNEALKREVWHRKESEGNLRKLLRVTEQSPMGVVVTDREGSIEYVNPKFEEMTGYPFAELLGKSIESIDGDRPSVSPWEEVWETILAGRVWSGDYPNRRKNGEEYWEHASIAPVADGDGRITHFVIVKEDVTLRLRSQEELRLFRLLVDSSGQAVAVADADRRLQYANTTFLRWVGQNLETVEGRLLEDFCAPSSADRIRREVAVELETSGEWSGELTMGGPFGAAKEVLASFFLVRDESAPCRTALVATNVTELKAQQEEIERARRAAESADRAKGDFLARMSHEIRTPMNAILGMAHLMSTTALSHRQRDYLQKSQGAAEALLGLINDILDFSKIEAGKMTLESVPFDLDTVFEHLATVTALRAQEKGLKLLFDPRPDVPRSLEGDPLRLGQILVNLVTNAVKFTERGEVVVTVALEDWSPKVVVLSFAVRDTGVGISEDKIGALFQSFSQTDGSITRRYGGTGLGLAICKRLVEMMGGTIEVSSTPGVGSTFEFSALLELGKAQEAPLSPPEELRSLKVLLVDDNAVARGVISRMLTSLSFEVISTSGVEEALETLAEDRGAPVRLVVADGDLRAVADGTLHRALQELPSGPIPLVSLVSLAEDRKKSKGGKKTREEAVIKPVLPSSLLGAVLAALGRDDLRLRERTPSPRGGVSERWEGTQVLLAEDNDINRQIAREILEGRGVVVTVATNGREALEAASRREFDLVFLDIQMPEMDGLEAARRIRALGGAWETIPLVAMTAHAMERDRGLSLEAGMNDHVTKPIDPDGLFETMERWILRPEKKVLSASGPEEVAGAAPPPFAGGVDLARGAERLGVDEAFYRHLLRLFVEEQIDLGIALKGSGAEPSDELRRRIHTLKGTAGNLALDDLAAVAGALERALDSPSSEVVEEAKDNVLEEWRAVREELVALLGEEVEGDPEAEPMGLLEDREEARRLLEEGRALLDDDLPKAEARIAEARRRAGREGEDLFQTLDRMLRHFDTDGAASVLDQLVKLLS